MIELDSREGVFLGCMNLEATYCGELSNARRIIDEGTRANCSHGKE